MGKPIVVKFGGSVITNKNRKFSLRRGVLERLARELKTSPHPVVLIHGGGSFGHPVAKLYRGRYVNGYVEIHRAMERLNRFVSQSLEKAGIRFFSLPPSTFVRVKNAQIVWSSLSFIRWLIRHGIVPVTYGDIVPDGKGASILSGDKLASYLALKLQAKRVIVCIDVDGVYVRTEKGIQLAKEFGRQDLERLAMLPSATDDVTGGMKSKLEEFLAVSSEGIDVIFINGKRPGFLRKALEGEEVLGTVIRYG